MPRGRHRHSPSLHRLLPPAAVATAALACAGGTWLVGEPGFADTDTVLLRGLAGATALAAVTGAYLARRWDRGAGRRVSELKARLAGAEWRAEEQQAELEGDIEESRALREAVEGKLVEKRAELARLRSEHAALLRRYAHAETERAGALEGRRLLQIEAGSPSRALTSGATDHRKASGAPTPLTYLQANEALKHLKRSAERQREQQEQRVAREEAERRAAAEESRRAAAASPFARPASGQAWGSGRSGAAGGGFDFFGTSGDAAPRSGDAGPPPDEGGGDRPDPVVALPAERPGTRGKAGKVIDLAGAAASEDDGASPGAGEGDDGNESGAGASADGGAGALDITELRGAIS